MIVTTIDGGGNRNDLPGVPWIPVSWNDHRKHKPVTGRAPVLPVRGLPTLCMARGS